jgi:uracil-DNA glycosylase
MTSPDSIRLHDSWKQPLLPVLQSPTMQKLRAFLQSERDAGKTIFPAMANVFKALDCTPLNRVKVVVLGQDPYPGIHQAHGLSFSVLPGVPVPRSLVNIYKELKDSLDINPARHGCLQSWADQGVLLLNNVLTVRANEIASHKGKGWEYFTDAVVELINSELRHVVFLLWGRHAQEKGARIDATRHLVLKAAHPSPMSAHQGFFGCNHFALANDYLLAHGKTVIDWQLPETA